MPPATLSPTRPFYWSVRRELWENRSIYLAPLIAVAVVLVGFLIGTIFLADSLRAMTSHDATREAIVLARRYDLAAVALILTGLFVAVFYCLDALHAERRDRSILFWKSLPVSDVVTVLSKASIPLAVLPVITFVLTLAAHLVMLLLATAVLLLKGLDASPLWEQVAVFPMSTVVLLYGLVVLALWYAPVYAWLLLVSGWAKRATLLWAVMPPLAIMVIERIGFGTSHFAAVVKQRLAGGFAEAFVVRGHGMDAVSGLPQIDPLRFFSSPGLWVGLATAAALLALAVRQRKYRDPI
jgi:ABC-2 type transport system permease protein